MESAVCCFTGHRDLLVQEIDKVTECLKRQVNRLAAAGVHEFRSGGARGFDLLAAEAVLWCREGMPEVKLIMVLPCPEQDKSWIKREQVNYRRILSLADQIIYTAPHYFKGCMHLRNRRLVDGASLCIAYLKEYCGGTGYTVEYALKKGVGVINLAEE